VSVGRREIALALGVGSVVLFASVRAPGAPVTVEIPDGATLPEIAEILEERGIVRSSGAFHAYTRLRRADRRLKAGTYRLTTGSSVRSTLDRLLQGQVETVALVIPEGFRLQQMAPRVARVTGGAPNDVLRALRSEELLTEIDVPGPTLEGYLFPDTYRFARGVSVREVASAMVDRYMSLWTDERRSRLAASGLTEREVVTLASIIQAEARQVSEMPRISGVYHNRLTAGWRLQADPTVLYALGGYRERLLFAAIDSVQDSPYNTYSMGGLPPGPIGSPGEDAIDAALHPEHHDFMYFVARPDGSHAFSRSLTRHNEAIREIRGRDGS